MLVSMTDFLRVRNAESASHMRLTKTKHTADGKVTESRRKTTMSEPCMIDPFEECFRDCPNCRRAIYDDNDNIYDDDERDEDEWE